MTSVLYSSSFFTIDLTRSRHGFDQILFICLVIPCMRCRGQVLYMKSTLKYWPSKEQRKCVMWLLLAGNLTFLILFLLTCCSFRNYKKRSRDDKEFNEHMFAINYYAHYLNKENNHRHKRLSFM